MIFLFLILFVFIAVVDIYVFQAFKVAFSGSKAWVNKIYWGFTAYSVLVLTAAALTNVYAWPKPLRIYLIAIIFVVYLSKLVVVLFLLIDDIIRLGRWVFAFFASKTTGEISKVNGGISRLVFLNRLGLIVGAIPLGAMVWGMVRGAYDYTIRRAKVPITGLPDAFKGFKIIQISDLHVGSFMNSDPLKRAVDIINKQQADVVFFTGDLVNNSADETAGMTEVLSQIKAKHGVYSILGNHDYGDYIQWESAAVKSANLDKLKGIHKQMGWKLLLNEHTMIEQDGAQLTIIGMENWGAYGHFSRYGDLQKAMTGLDPQTPKILLSHDPSHWTEKVSKENPDIHLTLSGHTHGMQFGVEIPGFKWSPIQYMYKNWAGLYQKENQYLYVNRGLGFLGYPGRVGILPEITVIELT